MTRQIDFETYVEHAIERLELGIANEYEKTLVLANEAIGILKNGGLVYFYNYDFPDGISYNEVIDAHSIINPKIKDLHDEFQKYLSSGFMGKNQDERYAELNVILDEDGLNQAHSCEDKLFELISDDFKKLEKWLFDNVSEFEVEK